MFPLYKIYKENTILLYILYNRKLFMLKGYFGSNFQKTHGNSKLGVRITTPHFITCEELWIWPLFGKKKKKKQGFHIYLCYANNGSWTTNRKTTVLVLVV